MIGSIEVKALVWQAVHEVLCADGAVDPRELLVAEQLMPGLSEIGLVCEGQPTDRCRDLADRARRDLPRTLSVPEKHAILDQLYAVALADGDLHREEGWVLAHTARMLGLSGGAHDEWLASKRRSGRDEQALRLAFVLGVIDEIALADGAIHDAERSQRERLAPLDLQLSLGLCDAQGRPTKRRDDLAREARAELPIRLSIAEKIGLLDELFEVAAADGRCHREESWVIGECARSLGLTGAQFDEWLAGKPLAQRARVLSYSAGSTQTGPDGYRSLRKGPDLIALVERWPDIAEPMRGRTPLVINAYPAALGRFEDATYVDTYLSPKTASRALQLSAREGLPSFLLGQPLLVAEILLRHTAARMPLPDLLVLFVGGYALPASLARALKEALRERGYGDVRLEIVCGYGAAEVDAGMLFGRPGPDGEVVYAPRGPDVIAEISPEGELTLGLVGPAGPILSGFGTGDRVETVAGGLRVVNAASRMHPDTASALASWTAADWARRTGYLSRASGRIQLREGVLPEHPAEMSYHAFAEAFGGVWLAKPDWR